MGLLDGVRRLFRVRRVERDVREELGFHFERTVEELMGGGMSEEEARAEAERRFGDVGEYTEALEEIDRSADVRRRRRDRLGNALLDLRHGLRALRRAPGFSAAVVLAFALGIGANATMFGIVDRLLLRPPAHIQDAEGVKRIMGRRYLDFIGEHRTSASMTYPGYVAFRGAERLADAAAYHGARLTLGRGEAARQVQAMLATGNFFSLLGVRPALGRFFGPADDRRGAPAVAVLGHGLWQRAYGGDPSVVGETLDFGYGPYTIVGVAPEGFTGVDLEPVDLWLPLGVAGYAVQGEGWAENSNWYWLRVVGRLPADAQVEAAEAELTVLYRQTHADAVERGSFDPDAEVLATSLIAARGPTASGEASVAKWLAAVSLIVLLIACANVANLLLARSVRRRRETGIRLALGISRGRLLASVLIESLLLALAGAAAALGLAAFGGDVIRTTLLPQLEWSDAVLTPRMLAFIGIASLVAGVLAGLIPAIQASRPDVVDSLKAGGRSGRGATSRTRALLSITQAALSVVLLVGAGLFVRSLNRVEDVDVGLDPDRVLLVHPVTGPDAPEGEERIAFVDQLIERLEALPGVERAAAATASVPFRTSNVYNLTVPGLDSVPTLPSGSPYVYEVTPGYLETMGIRVLRGRGFLDRDREGSPPVTLVNETMARTLWPGEDALGKCFHVSGSDCMEVVGIVEETARHDLAGEPAMQYYISLRQRVLARTPRYLFVRTAGAPGAVRAAVRNELLAAVPWVRHASVQTYREVIDPEARAWRLGATMFTAFGLLALLVAAIGLYSVLAFNVAQRTHELGIRAALGAGRRRLMRMVVGHALRLVAWGVAVGLAIALVAAPRLEELLFRTSPHDAVTLTGVVLTLAVVSLAASWIPARRATAIDPNEALRTE